jgi:FKBP-type peptidyl-prolyl cis-trans isomerase
MTLIRYLILLLVPFLLFSCKKKPKKSITELPTEVAVFEKETYLQSKLDSQAILSIKSFGNQIDSAIYQIEIDSISKIISKEKDKESFHTKSGILYIIEEYGSGEYPVKGDVLEVKVETTTLDGKNVFSTTKLKQNLQFILGVGQVVPAWDEVFLNVQECCKFQIIVPSALSYGSKGIIKAISPNTILKYDITFEKIIQDKKASSKDQPQLKIKENKKESQLKDALPSTIRKPKKQ